MDYCEWSAPQADFSSPPVSEGAKPTMLRLHWRRQESSRRSRRWIWAVGKQQSLLCNAQGSLAGGRAHGQGGMRMFLSLLPDEERDDGS